MNDDLKLGSMVLAFCAFLWLYAIPAYIQGFPAALFPRILVLGLAVAGALFLGKGILAARSGGRKASSRPSLATLRALGTLPMMVAYVYLIDIVGFYVTTAAAILAFLLYFGARRSVALVVYPLVLPLIVYLVIGRLLHFPFPDGILF